MKPRVAFVVQRCGPEILGGAEHLALALARRLATEWDIDILTTTAKDYVTWANHYPAGETPLAAGVTLKRFAIRQAREIDRFATLCGDLERAQRAGTLTRALQEEWLTAQGPDVPDLYDYVARNKATYAGFCFFSYPYSTTAKVLPLVADRAILVPCAHDDWTLRLPIFGELLSQAQVHHYLTPEERDLVVARTAGGAPPGVIVACGMPDLEAGDAERFRGEYDVRRPFALFLGRLDAGKNVPELFDYWQRLYRESRARDTLPDLVLIGPSALPIPLGAGIRYLGPVDDRQRADALAACDYLINPSRYESLSLVLLEAWSAKRPVLVDARCAVTAGQVGRASGGLTYADFQSFRAAVYALREVSARAVWGAAGHQYVMDEYRWEPVIGAYRESLDLMGGD
jgi:glycosyltransferase involved in cell wall biosynthesis